jgi:hypothetical protein
MTTTAPAATPTSSRRWLALAVIAAAQFMVIMDTSIIGVALPKMQTDLGFDPQDLSWVFNAYVVAFGGLLLLGGRLSDLFGARRIFSIGWVVLSVGSLVAASPTASPSSSPAAPSRAPDPPSSPSSPRRCCSRCSAAATTCPRRSPSTAPPHLPVAPPACSSAAS